MAFKDLENYYASLKASYFSVLEQCNEFDKHCGEGVTENKMFKKFKKDVAVIRDRYETLMYFFMLWSKPDAEEKKECELWEKEHKTQLNYLSKRSADKILKENSKLLDDINNYISNQMKGK